MFKGFPVISNPLKISEEQLSKLISDLERLDPEARYTDNQLFSMYLEGERMRSVKPMVREKFIIKNDE